MVGLETVGALQSLPFAVAVVALVVVEVVQIPVVAVEVVQTPVVGLGSAVGLLVYCREIGSF